MLIIAALRPFLSAALHHSQLWSKEEMWEWLPRVVSSQTDQCLSLLLLCLCPMSPYTVYSSVYVVVLVCLLLLDFMCLCCTKDSIAQIVMMFNVIKPNHGAVVLLLTVTSLFPQIFNGIDEITFLNWKPLACTLVLYLKVREANC